MLAAHGSPHPAHQPAVEALRDAVRQATGRSQVDIGWIDFAEPALARATASAVVDGVAPVVVPLLLAAGYHARVDIPAMVAGVPGATVTPVLGPDPLLAAALARRLDEAGVPRDAPVVLAAAGSSDPGVPGEVEAVAALLAANRGGAVRTAYATGPLPRVADVVDACRRGGDGDGGAVVVATYLLFPGALAARVADQAGAAGVATVTGPLAATSEVQALVQARWARAEGG